MAQTQAVLKDLLKPRNKPRACDGCGETYNRRNLVECWVIQNVGHRLGWVKRRLRLCTKKCSPAPAARRIMMAASRIERIERP